MLKKFRQQIDLIDKKILKLLSERATIAKDVAEYKKNQIIQISLGLIENHKL